MRAVTGIGGLAALSLDAMASVAHGSEAIVIVLAVAGGVGLEFMGPTAVAPADRRKGGRRAGRAMARPRQARGVVQSAWFAYHVPGACNSSSRTPGTRICRVNAASGVGEGRKFLVTVFQRRMRTMMCQVWDARQRGGAWQ